MTTDTELNPEDFVETARAVTTACAEAAGLPERMDLLAEAGLTGILAPEAVGGMDLPLGFAVPVLRAAGGGFLAAPLLECMLLARAFAGVDDALASAIVSGEMPVTVAWSGMLGGTSGVVGRAPLAEACARVLVLGADEGGVLVTPGEGAMVETESTLDLERPEARVRVTAASGPELSADAVARLRADALVLRAALILGAAEDCLSRAADYAQERVQFGRPLSANQSIQHHLARDCLAVETIRNNIHRSLSPECAVPAAAARATFVGAATLGARVAESAIQVHGGMGFTWEVPLHRHLRMIKALAAQGGAADLIEAVAADLLANAA
ncbi:acyl-CoA dehydrogenase family protein [Albibacillus kandeliae]|uniref:acyl-CoA dehydrogenase family protein n=1 Tax=Albibacillus kandeliae TaxID=2174228 RepID=UPI000D68DA8A|nr:acyl-CoA dehydrogenase family protein [Albibacillus kandeliae]